MSVKLFFQNLAVNGAEDRLPLSFLNLDENSHVHGGLRFQIDNRLVPHMGFFGPDDVCFNTWLTEFENIIKAFDAAQEATYIFDEGEQGQPAYLFEKGGERVYFSIVDAGISGGKADPAWQRVEFDYQEFKGQYAKFKKELLAAVEKAAPNVKEEWVKQFLSRAV